MRKQKATADEAVRPKLQKTPTSTAGHAPAAGENRADVLNDFVQSRRLSIFCVWAPTVHSRIRQLIIELHDHDHDPDGEHSRSCLPVAYHPAAFASGAGRGFPAWIPCSPRDVWLPDLPSRSKRNLIHRALGAAFKNFLLLEPVLRPEHVKCKRGRKSPRLQAGASAGKRMDLPLPALTAGASIGLGL